LIIYSACQLVVYTGSYLVYMFS